MNRLFRRRRAFGFTLVELLVVIGIIAVLISILLPALSRARKSANTTKCMSALRQIAYAFTMYSKDNRGKYPVVKFDPLGAPIHLSDGTDVSALYWEDFLWKYTSNAEAFSRANTGSSYDAQRRFQAIRASVFWGCPEWDGSYWTGNTKGAGDQVSFSENGYAYNIFPMFNAQTTVADYSSGQKYHDHIAMDSTENNLGRFSSPAVPYPYHFFKDWAPSADRCLVTESTLWLLTACPTDPAKKGDPTAIGQQPATKNGNNAAVSFATAGVNNIDRYRHGKYPPVEGDFFSRKGGRVAFNVLFADGHVATMGSIQEGYKTIQMRDP